MPIRNIGLLGGDTMSDQLLNIGIGLLSASGPSTRPIGIGEALAAGFQTNQQAQLANLRNQVFREEIGQRARQREARQQLLSRLSQPVPTEEVGQGMGALSAEGLSGRQQLLSDPQTLGLLAEAAPELVFGQSGLLAQQFGAQELTDLERNAIALQRLGVNVDEDTILSMAGAGDRGTSLIRNVEAGFDPNRPLEQRQAILADLAKDDKMTEALLAQIQLMQRQFEFQRMVDEHQREQVDRETQRDRLVTDIRSDFDQIVRLAEANEALRGTPLEPGPRIVPPEQRRALAGSVNELAEFLGTDRSEARKVQSEFDTFVKGTTDFALSSMSRILDRDPTNFLAQQVVQASAGLGVGPDANNEIFANAIDAMLEANRIDDLGLTDAEVKRFRENADRLRGRAGRSVETREDSPVSPSDRGAPTELQPLNIPVSRISRMRRSELNRLDTSRMTEEQLEAAARRFEELRNQ